MTATPCFVSTLRPSGDTGIGRHGAKMRSSSNGHSRAMPLPPSVNASRTPWLTMTSDTVVTAGTTAIPRREAARPTTTPHTSANETE